MGMIFLFMGLGLVGFLMLLMSFVIWGGFVFGSWFEMDYDLVNFNVEKIDKLKMSKKVEGLKFFFSFFFCVVFVLMWLWLICLEKKKMGWMMYFLCFGIFFMIVVY